MQQEQETERRKRPLKYNKHRPVPIATAHHKNRHVEGANYVCEPGTVSAASVT